MVDSLKIVGFFENKLRFKGYSKSTISSYSFYIRMFVEFTNKRLSHITKKDAYVFLDECSKESIPVKNHIISSLKLFYRLLLNTSLDGIKTERPRKQRRLPRAISDIEPRLLLIKNIKHRAILECGYRCALRVSEVCNILIEDIDLSRRCILIRNSKFNKDRYVPVSEKLEFILLQYFDYHSPELYLFEGKPGHKYSTSSCQKIFKKHIDTTKSFHTLRHSCATKMIDNNSSLRVVQEILGHSSSRTTEIYTHVSMASMLNFAI
jgi:integrase/recombinase XerD